MGWTTGRASRGVWRQSPSGVQTPGAPGQGSSSLKQKAFWCLYIHRSGQIIDTFLICGGKHSPSSKSGVDRFTTLHPLATPLVLVLVIHTYIHTLEFDSASLQSKVQRCITLKARLHKMPVYKSTP